MKMDIIYIYCSLKYGNSLVNCLCQVTIKYILGTYLFHGYNNTVYRNLLAYSLLADVQCSRQKVLNLMFVCLLFCDVNSMIVYASLMADVMVLFYFVFREEYELASTNMFLMACNMFSYNFYDVNDVNGLLMIIYGNIYISLILLACLMLKNYRR